MNFIQKAKIALQFVGLPVMLRALNYSVLRARLQKKYLQPSDSHPPLPTHLPTPAIKPGNITAFLQTDRGGTFTFQNGMQLSVEFLDTAVLAATWTPGSMPLSHAIVEQDWPAVAIEYTEEVDGWRLESEQLALSVVSGGSLNYHTPDGHLLRQELPPIRQGKGWTGQVMLSPDEHIFGLGERTAGLNLRGGTFQLWNIQPGGSYGPGADPIYLSIPTYLALSQRGSYLVFHENHHRGFCSFPNTGPATIHFEAGAFRTYFMLGSPAQTISCYTRLTGRPDLPPRWALGFHQSRWGYKTEDDIRMVSAGFYTHNLPLAAIHLDIDYMDGYRVFTINKNRFPNMKHLADDLANHDIRLVAILDPGVKQDSNYDVYITGNQGGHFCKLPDGSELIAPVWPGWCAFPDFAQARTRNWWGAYYSRLFAEGIAGIWHDMNEPTAFAAWGKHALPDPTQHNHDGETLDHIAVHNLYGLLMAAAGYNAIREFHPTKRPWMLSRSGWAGIQRFSWHWTGDVESSWAALKMTISEIIGLGLSGIAFSGSDIGGFSGAPTPELFVRWFQMASLMPFFRSHAAAGTPAREPWAFGEPVISICRKFLQLRQRLMPYLYTLAWEASQTGYPLVRPVFWDHPEEEHLWEVDDVFLLGNNLLVAPVLNPQAAGRSAHLPPGGWYDFWTGKLLPESESVFLDAPLDHLPILIRAGAVLPLSGGKGLELHIFPGETFEAVGTHYDDAGDGFGGSRVDHFHLSLNNDYMILSWEHDGEFPVEHPNIKIHFYGITILNARSSDGQEIEVANNQIQTPPFHLIYLNFQ